MKYILVIGDGMADNPVPELGNRTPLEAAKKPVMDRLAKQGMLGSVVNCPKGLPAGSETAILSIFGYDPLRFFTGRSPMEQHFDINYIKSVMFTYGAYGAQMTGTGSAVFGIFDSFEYATVACTMLKDRYPQVFMATNV